MSAQTFRARSSDPWTSQQAAGEMRRAEISQAIYLAVLDLLLAQGPLTDEQIFHRLEQDPEVGRWITPSGLRTRRKTMERLEVVYDTGHTRKTLSGHQAILWGVVGVHSRAAGE